MTCNTNDCTDVDTACTNSASEDIGTTSVYALACNAGRLDEAINSSESTFNNRRGDERFTLEGLSQKFGFIIEGDFATGFTITTRNQLGQDASGDLWRWTGDLPHIVTAGTVPSTPDYDQVAIKTDTSNLIGAPITTKNVAGSSDITLTTEECFNRVIELGGEITADINVNFQDDEREWVVFNNTFGNFIITVKTISGVGVVIKKGETQNLRSDGTNMVINQASRWSIGNTTGGTPVEDTPNSLSGHSLNYISPDVHSCVIAGGGAINRENVIGGDITKVDLDESNVFPNVSDSLGYDSRYATIGGGYDNVCNGLSNAILVGFHCYIDNADHCTLSGGSYHKITEGQYCVVGGGTNNAIATSAAGTIAGGRDNEITKTGNDSGVTIGGGRLNSATQDGCTISGGVSNSVDGTFAYVGGGTNNSTTQNSSVVMGGNSNIATGTQGGVIIGGLFNSLSGESAVVLGGRENSSSANYTASMGYQAVADRAGVKSFANGSFANDGDAQKSDILLKVTSTDENQVILRDISGGAGFENRDDAMIAYKVRVTGHRTDVQGDNALIVLEGIAHRSTGVWTVLSAADINVSTANAGTWTASVIDASGSLRVVANGESGKDIQWLAHVDFIENIG